MVDFGYYNMYGRSSSYLSTLGVCLILAVIGGIVLYFTFLSKKNEHKFTGFLGWLYDFLNFKKLVVEAILKVLYLITACYMTLGGFVLLFSSFGVGILMMTFGNIVARISYEFLLILILICKNTSEINNKMKDNNSKDPNSMFVSGIEIPKKPEVTKNTASQETSSSAAEPQKTSFCPKCGTKISTTDEFCSNCGNKLK